MRCVKELMPLIFIQLLIKIFHLGAGFGRRTSTYTASSSVVLMPSGHDLGPRNPQTPPS